MGRAPGYEAVPPYGLVYNRAVPPYDSKTVGGRKCATLPSRDVLEGSMFSIFTTVAAQSELGTTVLCSRPRKFGSHERGKLRPGGTCSPWAAGTRNVTPEWLAQTQLVDATDSVAATPHIPSRRVATQDLHAAPESPVAAALPRPDGGAAADTAPRPERQRLIGFLYATASARRLQWQSGASRREFIDYKTSMITD